MRVNKRENLKKSYLKNVKKYHKDVMKLAKANNTIPYNKEFEKE